MGRVKYVLQNKCNFYFIVGRVYVCNIDNVVLKIVQSNK